MTALKTGQVADNRQKKIISFSFILLMLAHVIFTFAGFYGDDDINYARYAAEVAHNGISFSPAIDQFQLRWVTVYSTALFYWLFGINTIYPASKNKIDSLTKSNIQSGIFMVCRKNNVYLYKVNSPVIF